MSGEAASQPGSQRPSISEAIDNKPVARQLISNCLATVRVVFDVEDLNEIPPLLSPSRFQFILISSRSQARPMTHGNGRPEGLFRVQNLTFNSV